MRGRRVESTYVKIVRDELRFMTEVFVYLTLEMKLGFEGI